MTVHAHASGNVCTCGTEVLEARFDWSSPKLKHIIPQNTEVLHCKNEGVYCTPFAPIHTLKTKQCVYWDKMMCSKHFHFYSVQFAILEHHTYMTLSIDI